MGVWQTGVKYRVLRDANEVGEVAPVVSPSSSVRAGLGNNARVCQGGVVKVASALMLGLRRQYQLAVLCLAICGFWCCGKMRSLMYGGGSCVDAFQVLRKPICRW